MDVVERPEQNRFEWTLDGGMAVVAYRRDGERLVLVHAEVPEALSGKGVGSQLAKSVFEIIRASGRKAVLRCPFLVAWAARHPGYDDIIDD